MTSTYSRVGALAAALVVAVGAVGACSKPSESAGSAAPSTTGAAAGTTSAVGAEDTVVFEVTGTGTALTIDLVPAGDKRLLNVPLPWSTTVTITPDVAQLQVVVVGSGDAAPGCKITLNGELVAEKPDGGDAHCVFDR